MCRGRRVHTQRETEIARDKKRVRGDLKVPSRGRTLVGVGDCDETVVLAEAGRHMGGSVVMISLMVDGNLETDATRRKTLHGGRRRNEPNRSVMRVWRRCGRRERGEGRGQTHPSEL